MADSGLPPSRFIDVPAIEQVQTNGRDVNADLLERARAHFQELVRLSRLPPSSWDLMRLQTNVNLFALSTDNQYRHVDRGALTVVDPIKLDIAHALGFSDGTAVQMVLPEKKMNEAAGSQIYSTMNMDEYSKFGTLISTSEPQEMGVRGIAGHILLPLPLVPLKNDLLIEGLSYEQTVEFVNRHESWHSREDVFELTDKEISLKKKYTRTVGNLDYVDRKTLPYIAKRQHAEAFADLGAIGDMIRNGSSTDIIDKIARWRRQSAGDTEHRTEESLYALKEKIAFMGLETFRAVSDERVADFYMGIVEEHGMTKKALNIYADFATATQAGREKLSSKENKDRDFFLGQRLFEYSLSQPESRGTQSLSSEQAAAFDAYNPIKELKDRAVKDNGMITPETLVKAYTGLQTDLQNQLKEEPENDLLPAKMGELRAWFKVAVGVIDYVEENKKRGIDITQVIPVSLDQKHEGQASEKTAFAIKSKPAPSF